MERLTINVSVVAAPEQGGMLAQIIRDAMGEYISKRRYVSEYVDDRYPRGEYSAAFRETKRAEVRAKVGMAATYTHGDSSPEHPDQYFIVANNEHREADYLIGPFDSAGDAHRYVETDRELTPDYTVILLAQIPAKD